MRIDRSLYDPARWPAVVGAVYAPAWHVLGMAPAEGEAVPVTLLPGVLDEPLLMVGDAAGPRVYSNACTHRGALLLDRPGRVPLRCPYHGRRFASDGRCLAAPGFPAVPDEPLPELPARRFGPLVLTTLGGGGDLPLGEPALARLHGLDPAALTHDPGGDAVFEVTAHPFLYLENYLEGFHIPFVHPALARALDPRDYRGSEVAGGFLQVGTAVDGDPAFDPPPGHPEHGARVAAWYLALFPTVLLNVYPWGVSVNLVEPVGPDRTRIRYLRLVARPELSGRGAGAGLDRVEREDDAIVERVHAGARGRLYRGGGLSAEAEPGVAAFQAWVRDRLGATRPR